MGVVSVMVTVDWAVLVSVWSLALPHPVTLDWGAMVTVSVSSSSSRRSVAVAMVRVAVVALCATVTVAGGLVRSAAAAAFEPVYP